MQLLKRMRHLFQPRALVLMYHRIDELKNDPWQLAVSPNHFEQQLQVLQETGKLITVKELVSSLNKKTIPHDSICITFDDGYADNYFTAKPLLEKYRCPATFFIPTHYTGQERPFWWDELESILLCYPELPERLSLLINETLFEFDLGTDSRLTVDQLKEHSAWAWPATPPTRRCQLYLAIWERLRPLSYNVLQSVLNDIKYWASFRKSSAGEGFPMNFEQLKELSRHALIDLSLHTDTHPALSSHAAQVQHAEISINRQYLESICGRPVETIAYPYGNYNDITLSVVQELNLTGGFTTSEKIVSNFTEPFQIGRFQVRNWGGNDFKKWLFKWKNESRYL